MGHVRMFVSNEKQGPGDDCQKGPTIGCDATDIKKAIQTTVTGKCSGDIDLGDGKLEEMRAEFDARFVRKGILSVADYSSSWMGVAVVVIIIVIVRNLFFLQGLDIERPTEAALLHLLWRCVDANRGSKTSD